MDVFKELDSLVHANSGPDDEVQCAWVQKMKLMPLCLAFSLYTAEFPPREHGDHFLDLHSQSIW